MDRYFPASYAHVFLWGIAVLFGMIGLGRVVARVLRDAAAAQVGWGLHAVWGMAVYLFVGAVLATAGWFADTSIVVLIGAGCAAWIWTTYRGGWLTWSSVAAWPWPAWPAFAVVALLYAAGFCWQLNINPADDFPAYYSFCEKLLTTGSFDDPFSWRRLASLGGQTLLQCSVLARGSYVSVQAFEISLCPVILLGVIVGFRDGQIARSPLGLLIALLAVTTPLLRINTASHGSTLVLLVGLFATLDLADRMAAQRRRWLAVAGFVGAALCSLRAQNVAAAGGALGIFWLASWVRDRPALRAVCGDAASWGGALLAGLLPWMLMALRSNGSPLFPLFQGTNSLAFNPQSLAAPLHDRLTYPLEMLLHPVLLTLVLAMFALPAWRAALAARAVAVSAVLTALLLAYGLNLAPDQFTIPRYVQPMLLAGALAALLTAAVTPRARPMAWALGTVLFAANLPARAVMLGQSYGMLTSLEAWKMPFGPRTIKDYRVAQALVPEGRRIVVAGDYPMLFDHYRNPIWIIDMPHACSPAPGLPFQKPPEATKRYLRQLGVEYLIFMDYADSAMLYNRGTWELQARGEPEVALWKLQAPFYLDFFNTSERLAASESMLGKVGTLTVLQLNP